MKGGSSSCLSRGQKKIKPQISRCLRVHTVIFYLYSLYSYFLELYYSCIISYSFILFKLNSFLIKNDFICAKDMYKIKVKILDKTKNNQPVEMLTGQLIYKVVLEASRHQDER